MGFIEDYDVDEAGEYLPNDYDFDNAPECMSCEGEGWTWARRSTDWPLRDMRRPVLWRNIRGYIEEGRL